MAVIDHLKNAKREELVLEVAFGQHVVEGDLAKSSSDGTTVKVQQMLGEAFGFGWKGVSLGVWFKGIRIGEDNFTFHPGLMSPGNSDPVQGIDPDFPEDTPHSNTCWINFDVPSDMAADYADNKKNPPEGFRTIIECQTGDVYDENGDVVDTNVYLTNAADAAAFLCKVVRRYPNARINWESLAALRDYCNAASVFDYTTLPEGVGITGSYYIGTNFGTHVLTRIDAVVEFNNSEGSPAFTLPNDNFSVKWEGFIKFRYSEIATLTLTADNGTRLWIGDLTTPLIDEWTNDGLHPIGTYTANFTADKDVYYPIRVDWNEGGGPGEIRLSWESASQDMEVVPQDCLYPKSAPQKNHECHVKVIAPTGFDAALSTVLASSNAFYQIADGQIHFYSFETLEPSFTFDVGNIISESVSIYMRYSQIEAANMPTRFQAEGLDLDSQYLEKFAPPVFFDVNKDDFSGHIRTKNVDVGNTRRPQAMKILKLAATLARNGWMMEFEGMPATYPVLQGDLVLVNWARMGWVNKKFLVFEATDKSINAGADERIFKLFEWQPYF